MVGAPSPRVVAGTKPIPAILGHEGVGVVTAMGERGEDRPVEIGNRVTWSIAAS